MASVLYLATLGCGVKNSLQPWLIALCVASVLYLATLRCGVKNSLQPWLIVCTWQVCFTLPLWDVVSRIHCNHGSSTACGKCALPCHPGMWCQEFLATMAHRLHVASVLYLATLGCGVKNSLQPWLVDCMWQVCFTLPLWDVVSRIHCNHGSSHCVWQVWFALATFQCDVQNYLHGWPMPCMRQVCFSLPLWDVVSRTHCNHGSSHCVWQVCFMLATFQCDVQS